MNIRCKIKLLLCILSLLTFDQSINKAVAIMANEKNVLGEDLVIHSNKPLTGYLRDGYCRTGEADIGIHVIGAVVTKEFLEFTKSRGNDLETPNLLSRFPGLKPGDKWCLCAMRWKEAYDAGVAPPLVLAATHVKALKYIPLEILKKYAIE